MIGRTLGWLGRTLVLVLSMLATLSIIGSIAAIPSGSVETRLGLPPQRYTPQPTASPGPIPRSPLPREATGSAAAPSREGIAGPAPPPPPPPDLLRWLEPLTYGVIALAGLMGLAVLLLWRAVTLLGLRR